MERVLEGMNDPRYWLSQPHDSNQREEPLRHVDVAVADRRETSDPQEEHERDLRAALLGIEATADRLSGHRDVLTAQQLDELTGALAHEVRGLRLLVEGRTAAVKTFDLAAALEPVVAEARASGSDVRCSVPRGIAVVGDVHRTAQVVFGLLDNARQHAPTSPIEVRARELCGKVAVYVEDRGRGVTGALRDQLFERGVCGDGSGGFGLGLYVARRVMEEQGGAIAVRSRPGGGATFVLHFRRVSACTYRTHGGERLTCGRSR
jgi:signal transduction histidine kinase